MSETGKNATVWWMNNAKKYKKMTSHREAIKELKIDVSTQGRGALSG